MASFQDEGARILQASVASERFRRRVAAAPGQVMTISLDELRAIALQFADVTAIATGYHLTNASVSGQTDDADES